MGTNIGYASIAIRTGTPPMGGALSVSSTTGVAGETVFTLTAMQWTTEPTRAPLSYFFGYVDLDEDPSGGESHLRTLTGLSQQTLVPVLLPPGRLRVYTFVEDVFGQRVNASVQVNVSLPAGVNLHDAATELVQSGNSSGLLTGNLASAKQQLDVAVHFLNRRASNASNVGALFG